MTENENAKIVVDVAFRVHVELGPGLLESVYQTVMTYELRKQGLRVDPNWPIPVVWDGVHLGEGYRADLLVEDRLIVELKSIEDLAPVHFKQTLTYLRLADKRLGLLINFNVALIKNGIHRVANGMKD